MCFAASLASEVLSELDALARDKDKDFSRLDVDTDAIRITSYHRPKGLEAPVVMLCFASRNVGGAFAKKALKRR